MGTTQHPSRHIFLLETTTEYLSLDMEPQALAMEPQALAMEHLAQIMEHPALVMEHPALVMEHLTPIMEPPALVIKHLATIIKLPSLLTMDPKQPTTLHSLPTTHLLLPPSQSRISIITTIIKALLSSQERTIK
jgi:hypothetical protein